MQIIIKELESVFLFVSKFTHRNIQFKYTSRVPGTSKFLIFRFDNFFYHSRIIQNTKKLFNE